MSEGHRHHLIVLRQSSRLLRWGQHPLAKTIDRKKAEVSRWQWREVRGGIVRGERGSEIVAYQYPEYHLTGLGILHALTGLTVIVAPDNDEEALGV